MLEIHAESVSGMLNSSLTDGEGFKGSACTCCVRVALLYQDNDYGAIYRPRAEVQGIFCWNVCSPCFAVL